MLISNIVCLLCIVFFCLLFMSYIIIYFIFMVFLASFLLSFCNMILCLCHYVLESSYLGSCSFDIIYFTLETHTFIFFERDSSIFFLREAWTVKSDYNFLLVCLCCYWAFVIFFERVI